jgi:hypothetical protein
VFEHGNCEPPILNFYGNERTSRCAEDDYALTRRYSNVPAKNRESRQWHHRVFDYDQESRKTTSMNFKTRVIRRNALRSSAVFAVALCVLVVAPTTGCGRVSQRVGRAAAKKAASVLGRDLARDNAARTLRLGQERRVFKYMTDADTKMAQRFGFGSRTHFTPTAKPGRPLSGLEAQKRYGLGYRPARRLTVIVPRGTPVKPNKVIGGAPGYGELRVERPLPPESIVTGSKLRRGGK